MTTATIKIFLPYGDPKRLRTAEISNWSGKALAAPRTDLDELLARDEASQSGVYILSGTDPDTGGPLAYVGEAEVLRERLKLHKAKDFWITAFAFVSKDENLTKAHVRHLEGRLIEEAKAAGRYSLDNSVASGSKLPESDRHDMEEFLARLRLLLPALGSELLTPIAQATAGGITELITSIKQLEARGRRTPSGFVVFKGSRAVLKVRPGAIKHGSFAIQHRDKLLQDGGLKADGDSLVFTRDVEFTSPSAAASVVCGGNTNGLTAWRTIGGKTLKEVESVY